jgi:hypothetical protein
MTRKRKRSPSAGRHSRTSDKTIKRNSDVATISTEHQKVSSTCGRSLSNHPFGRQPLPITQHNSHNTRIHHDNHNACSKKAEGLGSSARTTSTVQHSHLCKPKQKRNRKSANKEEEYEVEEILEARIVQRKLQYRAKWVGYGDDPVWYGASNFKNSPHRLHDFHAANPTQAGPPKRLRKWIQSWEETPVNLGHLQIQKL